MKRPIDYLTVNDPEPRSTLSNKEKIKLVIEAIYKLYFPSRKSNIILKRTKKNGLLACSRNEVLSVLSWLEKRIKVSPSNYPYEVIKPKMEGIGAGDSYKKPVSIDPKSPISIEVLSSFHSYHAIYIAKKNRKLSDLESDHIKAVKKLLLDIKKAFKRQPHEQITLVEDHPTKDSLRHKALDYLHEEDKIFYRLTNNSESKQIIEVCLDTELMESFNKKNNKPSEVSRSTKKSPIKNKEDKVLYTITYIKKGVLINNELLSKPNFDSENEAVIEYLLANPNKKVTKKMIEEDKNREIKKTFHKIVENLEFTSDLKKTFFEISDANKTIIFTNPVTEEYFKGLGIPRLKIK